METTQDKMVPFMVTELTKGLSGKDRQRFLKALKEDEDRILAIVEEQDLLELSTIAAFSVGGGLIADFSRLPKAIVEGMKKQFAAELETI